MARRRKKNAEEGEVEANLIPVMNVMFLLIPALLLAMEVARFAAINVSPPKFAASHCTTNRWFPGMPRVW